MMSTDRQRMLLRVREIQSQHASRRRGRLRREIQLQRLQQVNLPLLRQHDGCPIGLTSDIERVMQGPDLNRRLQVDLALVQGIQPMACLRAACAVVGFHLK